MIIKGFGIRTLVALTLGIMVLLLLEVFLRDISINFLNLKPQKQNSKKIPVTKTKKNNFEFGFLNFLGCLDFVLGFGFAF